MKIGGDMKKIYLIDDEPDKQAAFQTVFELLPKGVGFEAPWGMDPEKNAERSVDPESLLGILHTDDPHEVLILQDVLIPTSLEALNALARGVADSPRFGHLGILERVEELLERWHRRTRVDKDQVFISTVVMHCARERGIKVILAASNTRGRDNQFLQTENLAEIPFTTFPFAQEAEELAPAWANYIAAQEQPLISIREKTRFWFLEDPPGTRQLWPERHTGRFHLPHSYTPENLGENRIAQYQSAVRLVFPNSPDIWFSTDAAIEAYHVTMKSFLGSASEFGLPLEGGGGIGDRAVCLAAVHHVLLVANGFCHSGEACNGLLPSDWSAFVTQGQAIPFFPNFSSMPGVSRSLIADIIFDLHDLLRDMSIDKHSREHCVSRVVYPSTERAVYSIHFGWAEDDVDRFIERVSQAIDGLLINENALLARGKAAICLARIIIALQLGNVGRSYPGSRIELRRGSRADRGGLWMDFHAGTAT